MALDRDARLAHLKRQQYSLAAFHQLFELGYDHRAIRRRLDAQVWRLVAPRVIQSASAPVTWRSRVLAGCLSTGGVASHGTAGVLYELDGLRPGTPDITVARYDFLRRPRYAVHESTQFAMVNRRTVQQIPVTGPERTLLDIAALGDPESLEIALDSALRTHLTTLPRLADTHQAHRRRGRNGVGLLGELLRARSDSDAVPDSGGNRKLRNLLVRTGLPEPAIEHPILDQGRHLARADLAYPDRKVAIWLHSIRWHLNHLSFELDHAQQTQISALGWRTLVFTWDKIENHPRWVAEQVRRALDHSQAA